MVAKKQSETVPGCWIQDLLGMNVIGIWLPFYRRIPHGKQGGPNDTSQQHNIQLVPDRNEFEVQELNRDPKDLQAKEEAT